MASVELWPDLPTRHVYAERLLRSAPPDGVWPWLAQVGGGRAGFYSNDLLDNLGHRSAEEIVPGLQHLEIGQLRRMLRGIKARAESHAQLREPATSAETLR